MQVRADRLATHIMKGYDGGDNGVVMRPLPPPPPLEGLRQQIRKARLSPERGGGGTSSFVRETFRMNREDARQKAREWFEKWPKAAYWTEVESWRVLPDERIEFTMRRLPSAD